MATNRYNSNGKRSYRCNRSQNDSASQNKGYSDPATSAMYARDLMRQAIINPNVKTTRKSITYSIYTKENILSWLQSPSSQSSQKNLRKASQYMYDASMHYHRLISYYSTINRGKYVISPLGFDGDSVKDNFEKQYHKVAKALELMNLSKVMRDAILVALRDGAYYGILISDKNSAFVYPIDPDYCIITGICDGSFIYAVDISQLRDNLDSYPDEFTTMYNDYLRTGQKYQEVPQNLSFCIKADSTVLDYTIPLFSAVMPSVYTIANMESLRETATELKNYKMLAGKIPIDDKGAPLIDDALTQMYYQHVANALGENVGLAITPFDFDSISFERKDADDIDEVTEAVTNFWASAGTSGLLHGKDNNTAGVIKLAIKNDEAFVLDMISQFERLINRYLKMSFSGTSKFKITMLPVTIFNEEDKLQEYRNAATMGLGKSLYAAVLDIPQYDIAGLDYLEKNILGVEELTPMLSSYNTSSSGLSGDSEGEVGRPAESDEDLQESGVEARENDTNANR